MKKIIAMTLAFIMLFSLGMTAYAAPATSAGKEKDQLSLMAITDINGDFSVNKAEGKKLQFSYAGYKTQTVSAGRGDVNIKMEPDYLGLDEVVVVGYGTMKKSDLTGTTSNVKTEAIMANVTGNALEALQGKAAGVAVFNDNKPGESPQLRIMVTSVTSTLPTSSRWKS